MPTETKPHLNPPEVKQTTPPYLQPQAEIDPIHIAVTNNPNFRDSIVALLEGVSAEINANADDPNAVKKVAAKLKERSGTWADAAVANTNYAPVPTTETEKGRQEREAKENKEAKK
jgi:hypothetical protein